jgi:hypothetical protein
LDVLPPLAPILTLAEYERRFKSLTTLGQDIFEKITIGLQTFVLNPFSGGFQKYVVVGYHVSHLSPPLSPRSLSLPFSFSVRKQLQAKSTISNETKTKYLSQSLRSERVPLYYEIHSKGSQIREMSLDEVCGEGELSLSALFSPAVDRVGNHSHQILI